PPGLTDQFDLRCSEVNVRWHHITSHRRMQDDMCHRARGRPQHGIDRLIKGEGVQAEACGQRPLRIEIYQEHLVLSLPEGGAEINRCGGFADAALLLCYRNHCRVHSLPHASSLVFWLPVVPAKHYTGIPVYQQDVLQAISVYKSV